jgi:FixJ family two-component response regulator
MLEHKEAHDNLYFAAEPSLELVRQPSAEIDSPSHTIHLVDHDSEVLLFLFDFLSAAGFRVSASSNASDALDHVARLHPEILIANMEMPEVTGPELLMRVKMTAPSTRVILTSVRAERTDMEKVLQGGAADLISKPIERARLLRVLERVLAM